MENSKEKSGLTKRMRITDLDHSDAFYSERDKIIGQIFTINMEDFLNIHETISGYYYMDVNEQYTFFACQAEEVLEWIL